jgi:hypothetical protein
MSYDYVTVFSDNDWKLFQLIPVGTTGMNITENPENISPLSFESKKNKRLDDENILNLSNIYYKNNVLAGFNPN